MPIKPNRRGSDTNGHNGTVTKLSNNDNDLNTTPRFGGINRINCVENIRREWRRCVTVLIFLTLLSRQNFVLGPISTEPPSSPPNILSNNFIYTPINQGDKPDKPANPSSPNKDDDNDIQSTSMDICGQEYTGSSPGMRLSIDIYK